MKKDFIVRRSITMIEGKPHVETYSEQELVRCRDCKHYRYYGLDSYTVSECKIDHEENPADDWFCADGERETNSQKEREVKNDGYANSNDMA